MHILLCIKWHKSCILGHTQHDFVSHWIWYRHGSFCCLHHEYDSFIHHGELRNKFPRKIFGSLSPDSGKGGEEEAADLFFHYHPCLTAARGDDKPVQERCVSKNALNVKRSKHWHFTKGQSKLSESNNKECVCVQMVILVINLLLIVLSGVEVGVTLTSAFWEIKAYRQRQNMVEYGQILFFYIYLKSEFAQEMLCKDKNIYIGNFLHFGWNSENIIWSYLFSFIWIILCGVCWETPSPCSAAFI